VEKLPDMLAEELCDPQPEADPSAGESRRDQQDSLILDESHMAGAKV